MNKIIRLIGILTIIFSISVSVQAGEKIYFVQSDHLGTPEVLTDSNQNIVWRSGQDPFGDSAPLVEQITFNMRFPGQYFDSESGLHYNWNRYMDPETGRYITSDPIGLGGGMNTYGYVSGNPLRYSDPQGLCPTGGFICGAIAATAGRIIVGQGVKQGARQGLREGGRRLGMGAALGGGMIIMPLDSPVGNMPSGIPVAANDDTFCPSDDQCKYWQQELLQEYSWLLQFEELTTDGLDKALIRQSKVEYNRNARRHNRTCPKPYHVPVFLIFGASNY